MKTTKTDIKLLLIDGDTKDFPAFLQMMASIEARHTVDRPLELIYTDTLAAGLKQLSKGDIHLVLLGHPLPMGEEQAISKIHALAPQMPVIAVAADRHAKLAKDAVKNGANGYLLKGKNGTEELSRLIEQI